MRKLLWFIMLLVLTVSTRGQTAYSYRYWFDDDLSTQQEGAANGRTTIEIDISALAKGRIHALHVQGFDSRQKWGAAHTQYFFVPNSKSTTARYWFDDDDITEKPISTFEGMVELDIDSLGYGMHALHVQMSDADGYGSPVHTAYFYKSAEGCIARYWFDNEKTMQTESTMNGLVELDVTALGYGIHALHFQAFSVGGDASPVHTAYFYKGAEGSTARYWFDNEKTMQTVSTMNGLIELDVSGLGYGIHAVHFQAFSAGGDASPVHTAYFYKKEELDLSTVSCRLWIDDDESAAQTFALTDDIIMEAEDLSIGMHNLHVVLLNDIGMQLAETTAEFEVSDPSGIMLVPAFSKGDESIYNLAGQRLSKLRIGINIRNGKKVLVK